jgi:hypothetical protein
MPEWLPDRDAPRRGQERTDPDACWRAGKDLLERVVAPALREFSQSLGAGGLRGEVTVQEQGRLPPEATLLVAAEGWPLDPRTADSLTFQPDGPGGKVLVRARAHGTRQSGGAAPEGSFSVAELTPEKVDELVFLFVQRLLGY